MVRMNENRKGKVKSIFIHGRQRGQNSPVHLSRNFATLGPFPRLQPPCLTGPLLGSGATGGNRGVRLGPKVRDEALGER